MAFKKCKNDGCEIMIEVRNTAEGWRPFEESGNKHNCQFSDYAKKQRGDSPMREKKVNGANVFTQIQQPEEKDDHGNESKSWQHMNVLGDIEPAKNNADRLGYVDHTAKGQSKVKIFVGGWGLVEEKYDDFLKLNNGKIKTQGAQFQYTGELSAIALYYEEIKQ